MSLPDYLRAVDDGPPAHLDDGPAPWGDAVAPTDPSSADVFPPAWRLLDDVALMTLPDPDYLIAGILPHRGVGVTYGPPGAGKTTLMAALSVAIAANRPFFSHAVLHPGPVLYVGAEDPAGFKVRLRAAKRAAGLPLDVPIGVYTFPEALNLCDPAHVGTFERFLAATARDRHWELIIGDTYAAMTPGSAENSSEDTTTAMLHAQRWRTQLGATVLLNHHTNAAGTRERGHSAMRGAADFMICLTPVDDVVHVESSKQRNGPPFPTFPLRLTAGPDGEGVVFRHAADVLPDDTLTTAQAKALSILRDTFGRDGASKSEWQRTCPDIPERTFHRAAKVLEDRGHVQQVGTRFRVTARGQEAR